MLTPIFNKNMPILKQETKKIILPEIKAELKIKSVITYGDFLEVEKSNVKGNSDSMLELAAKLIIEWDITDEKKKTLPITGDNIKKLSNVDVNFLIKELTGKMSEKKTLK